jgi:hypothetical protein
MLHTLYNRHEVQSFETDEWNALNCNLRVRETSDCYIGIATCGISRDWWPINWRAMLWMLAALQQILFKCNCTTKLKILTFLAWISTTRYELSVKQSCLSYKRSVRSGRIFVVLCVCVCARAIDPVWVSDWQCSEVKFSLGHFTNYAEIWPLHNVCNIQMCWWN